MSSTLPSICLESSAFIKNGLFSMLESDCILTSLGSMFSTRELCFLPYVCRRFLVLFNSNAVWHSIDLSSFSPVAITDAVVTVLLRRHVPLRILKLGFCTKISNRTLQAVAVLNFATLEVLSLEGCFKNIDSVGLQRISATCHKLKSINLSVYLCANTRRYLIHVPGCGQLTSAVLLQTIVSCTLLETVHLGNVPGVDDSVLHHLGSLRFLHTLTLDACKLNPQSLIRLASSVGHHLRSLSLQYQRACSDEVVAALLEHCRELRELNMYGCTAITDTSLNWIGLYCSAITKLDVSLCAQISDIGLRNLCRQTHSLEYLALDNCTFLTDESITTLALTCPAMRRVSFFGCKNISTPALNTLVQRRADLIVVQRTGALVLLNVQPKIG